MSISLGIAVFTRSWETDLNVVTFEGLGILSREVKTLQNQMLTGKVTGLWTESGNKKQNETLCWDNETRSQYTSL